MTEANGAFRQAGAAVWARLSASIRSAEAEMDQHQRVAFWSGLLGAAHADMRRAAGEASADIQAAVIAAAQAPPG